MNTTELRTILSNVIFAREHLATVPEEKLDLGAYRRDKECGTLFCAMGELTTLPRFQEMGFKLVCMSSPMAIEKTWTLGDPDGESGMDIGDLMDKAFGEDAFSKLFATYGSGRWDNELSQYRTRDWNGLSCFKPITDKQLILLRFDKHIADLTAQLSSL